MDGVYYTTCLHGIVILTIKTDNMSKMKELDGIATGLANLTLEILDDSADWQLGDIPLDGDDYTAMKFHVVQMAISKMYEQVMR